MRFSLSLSLSVWIISLLDILVLSLLDIHTLVRPPRRTHGSITSSQGHGPLGEIEISVSSSETPPRDCMHVARRRAYRSRSAAILLFVVFATHSASVFTTRKTYLCSARIKTRCNFVCGGEQITLTTREDIIPR